MLLIDAGGAADAAAAGAAAGGAAAAVADAAGVAAADVASRTTVHVVSVAVVRLVLSIGILLPSRGVASEDLGGGGGGGGRDLVENSCVPDTLLATWVRTGHLWRKLGNLLTGDNAFADSSDVCVRPPEVTDFLPTYALQCVTDEVN